jgi:hypothetical protein
LADCGTGIAAWTLLEAAAVSVDWRPALEVFEPPGRFVGSPTRQLEFTPHFVPSGFILAISQKLRSSKILKRERNPVDEYISFFLDNGWHLMSKLRTARRLLDALECRLLHV